MDPLSFIVGALWGVGISAMALAILLAIADGRARRELRDGNPFGRSDLGRL